MNVQAKQIPEVTLTLSEYEALFLQTVMACIGGPESGPRAIADELHRKLYELGLDHGVFIDIPKGWIYFK